LPSRLRNMTRCAAIRTARSRPPGITPCVINGSVRRRVPKLAIGSSESGHYELAQWRSASPHRRADSTRE
jgi:hypothetical protein